MKLFISLLLGVSLAVAQGPGVRRAPTILKEPADWRPETMPIPPGFAPDIKLTGFEEARFAPGMFVIPRPDSKKTYLTLLISPQPKDAAAWRTLREIEGKLQM